MNPTPTTDRLTRLQAAMAAQGVDLAAIAPTANMRYLLGFAPHADERLSLLLVTPQAVELVIPTLNADEVEQHTGYQPLRWSDAEGPAVALNTALEKLARPTRPRLAVDDTMRADILLTLQRVIQPGESIPAGGLLGELRLRKTAEELERLRAAARMADAAVRAGVAACRPGITERAVAAEIERSFRESGAEQIDFLLVASGPNSAFPHHATGGRVLEAGDVVLLDVGGTLDGYKSDITRIVSLGGPAEEVRRAYAALRQANEQGQAAIKPGLTAAEVDGITRASLAQAGYGEAFIHRTGHGLGLEIHEPPSISANDETVLQPGMVFSVEPGVYFPGRFGLRLEDIVAVTDSGCERLTGLDHELFVNK